MIANIGHHASAQRDANVDRKDRRMLLLLYGWVEVAPGRTFYYFTAGLARAGRPDHLSGPIIRSPHPFS